MTCIIVEVVTVGETKRGLAIRKMLPVGEVFETQDEAIARYRELNVEHPGRSFGYYVKEMWA